MKRKTVQLAVEDVQALLHVLNLLVVSFDRLGSEFHDKPKRLAMEIDKFLTDIFAFKKLTRMRRILTDAYESQHKKSSVRQLERKLERIKYWPEHRRVGRRKYRAPRGASVRRRRGPGCVGDNPEEGSE